MGWCQWDCSMQERCTQKWETKYRPFNNMRPSRKSSDLHFLDATCKLRDRSSEQVVLCIAAKCGRKHEPWKKHNLSFLQDIQAQSARIGLWDGSRELVVAQSPCVVSAWKHTEPAKSNTKSNTNRLTNLEDRRDQEWCHQVGCRWDSSANQQKLARKTKKQNHKWHTARR